MRRTLWMTLVTIGLHLRTLPRLLCLSSPLPTPGSKISNHQLLLFLNIEYLFLSLYSGVAPSCTLTLPQEFQSLFLTKSFLSQNLPRVFLTITSHTLILLRIHSSWLCNCFGFHLCNALLRACKWTDETGTLWGQRFTLCLWLLSECNAGFVIRVCETEMKSCRYLCKKIK